MGQALSLVASVGCGAGLALAVGGGPARGAILGAALWAFKFLLAVPRSVPIPPKGGGIVISGASSGIGRAAAECLAQEGYTVFAGVRKASDGEPLKAAGCVPLILDVANEESVANAAAEVSEKLASMGKLLVALVNNAGVSGSSLPLELENEKNLDFVFNVNVFGILRMNKHFLPLLRQLPGGGARIGLGRIVAYCITAHPFHTIFTNIISERTMRPDPRRASSTSAR